MAVDTTCTKTQCSWADIVKGIESTQEPPASTRSLPEIAWNVCAEEFVPRPSAPVSTGMRAQAAEFVPSQGTISAGYESDLHPLSEYGQSTEGWQNLAVRLGNTMTIFEEEVDADSYSYSFSATAWKGDCLALNLALLSDDESDADSTGDVQESDAMVDEQDHSALGSLEGIAIFDELRVGDAKANNTVGQSDDDTCVSENGHSSHNDKDKDMEWCSDFDPQALSVDDTFSVAAVSDSDTDIAVCVKTPPGLTLPPWLLPSRSQVQSDTISLVSASESEADIVSSLVSKAPPCEDASHKLPLGVPPWRRKATNNNTAPSMFMPPPGLTLPTAE